MFTHYPHLWPSSAETKSLLVAVGQRDPQAWDEFVRLYAGGIYLRLRRLGFSPQDGADLVQDVLTSIYLNIERFERDGMAKKFRHWLAAILRNAARDEWRAQARKEKLLGRCLPLESFDEIATPDEDADSDAAAILPCVVEVALEEARATFKGHRWMAFWARFSGKDVPFAQIAAELSITEHAARQAHYYVLSWLKKRLTAPGLPSDRRRE